jgi:hypothetical protein
MNAAIQGCLNTLARGFSPVYEPLISRGILLTFIFCELVQSSAVQQHCDFSLALPEDARNSFST